MDGQTKKGSPSRSTAKTKLVSEDFKALRVYDMEEENVSRTAYKEDERILELNEDWRKKKKTGEDLLASFLTLVSFELLRKLHHLSLKS